MAQMAKFQGVQTSVLYLDSEIVGIYRGTEIARKLQGGKVRLNSGGWHTATTKARMNQFANDFCQGRFQVFQKGGAWFVSVNGEELNYFDGIEI